jgi:hypothetical protein
MITKSPTLSTRARRLIQSFLIGSCAVLCATAAFGAQRNYLVIDLAAPSGGATSNPASVLDAMRATLWTGIAPINLHPTWLLGSRESKSAIQGSVSNLQVGWGMGLNTRMQLAPIAWHGTAQSAAFLAVPFTTYGAQALGTDGVQIVGFATAHDGHKGSLDHALIWNATNGMAIDLGSGGNGAQALCVARGQQAGFTTRRSGRVATIWSGTTESKIVLHPNNHAITSEIMATNGLRQVGFCGFDVQTVDGTTNQRATKRINRAYVWDATAASARSIHPDGFTQSVATGISGSSIVGRAYNGYESENLATYHAILWNSKLQAIDLNAFLPDGFIGAMANSIDAKGTITGNIFTEDGTRHAALWIPEGKLESRK